MVDKISKVWLVCVSSDQIFTIHEAPEKGGQGTLKKLFQTANISTSINPISPDLDSKAYIVQGDDLNDWDTVFNYLQGKSVEDLGDPITLRSIPAKKSMNFATREIC